MIKGRNFSLKMSIIKKKISLKFYKYQLLINYLLVTTIYNLYVNYFLNIKMKLYKIQDNN